MTCHEVQLQLSLYLYGELDFASEEALETHLAECAFCQLAFAREKTWHTAASCDQVDAPLDLLAQCRQGLRTAMAQETAPKSLPARQWWSKSWKWPAALTVSPGRWSYQLAVGSFLVFLGFTGGRLLDRTGLAGGQLLSLTESGLTPGIRIRDIQPNGRDKVRILFEQVDQRAIVGSPEQEGIRQLLLAGVRDSVDPSLRVDSVEMLSGQDGVDVRSALLHSVQHDGNSAVRLKALESLQRFSSDPETRAVLRSVLERDSDPRVRAAAIDVIAPVNAKSDLSPELEPLLRNLARSTDDDYLRARSLEILHEMNASGSVY